MSEKFQPEKLNWTNDDFGMMEWHDCSIHAIALDMKIFEFLLDIDYIYQWVKPKPNEESYKFWVAPATMIFENVYNLDIELSPSDTDLQIMEIKRKNPRRPQNAEYINKEHEWEWTLDCNQGTILFRATGYKMFTRLPPILTEHQSLDINTRNGFSFLHPDS